MGRSDESTGRITGRWPYCGRVCIPHESPGGLLGDGLPVEGYAYPMSLPVDYWEMSFMWKGMHTP